MPNLQGSWEASGGGFTIRRGYVIIIRYACKLKTAGPAVRAAGERDMEHTAGAGSPTILKRPGGPIFTTSELVRLIGPLLVEQLLATTVGMADTMMVSRCGEAAISGVSLVDMINNLV